MKLNLRYRLVRFAIPVLAATALLPLAAPGASADVWYERNPNGCDLLVSTDLDPTLHSEGGCMLDNPVGAQGSGSDVYIFVRGTDSGVWYVRANDTYGNDPYNGWFNLGGRITGGLRAWTDSQGRVGVGGTGLDGNFWCTWNWSVNSDNFVNWQRC